jgi:hypothetical protein
VLTAGILVSGVADWALTQAGYEVAGIAVWILGYLGTMLVVWYLWLRPLDITGP